ncbi:hypothetical protein Y032_0010g1020 [Ancylostoma ceylanicum]|uniref:Uncharacterized protein n=1 Tax=Ancylostoma ceylanicum TaxID=53326 RepID=A0A016VFY9_9BILA|nr:hypothetical protein Y032_0010g1020 [Ancylostoma ceylanicum]
MNEVNGDYNREERTLHQSGINAKEGRLINIDSHSLSPWYKQLLVFLATESGAKHVPIKGLTKVMMPKHWSNKRE